MLDLTALDAVLKEHYSQKRVNNMVYKKNPLLAMIPKYEKFGGKDLRIPIRYSNPQNRGARFQHGQRTVTSGPSTTSASAFQDFVLNRVKNYSFAYLDGEAVKAAQGDMNTFVREAANEIDGAIDVITRDLAIDCFLDGTGVRGVIGSVTDTVVTLATPEDIVNFEVGQILQAAATAAGSVYSSTTECPTVTAVDRDAGTITLSDDVDSYAGTAWSADDFLFTYGDAPNGGANQKITGLAAYLPSSAPGSTLFHGVNRSVDTTRLGGIRYNGTSETLEEALIGAAVRASREGASPDICIWNHTHTGELIKSLGSKAVYDKVKSSDGSIGFDSLKVMTPGGTINVVSDLNCPVGVGYMLQLDTWRLNSLGKCPMFMEQDGLRMLRQPSSDSYEVRLGFYAQMSCDAPGWNVRIALPTA